MRAICIARRPVRLSILCYNTAQSCESGRHSKSTVSTLIMARIIVSGALANKPYNGGEAWVRLSWILGFKKLGSDVHFVEEIASSVCSLSRSPSTLAESDNFAYFKGVTEEFGLKD